MLHLRILFFYSAHSAFKIMNFSKSAQQAKNIFRSKVSSFYDSSLFYFYFSYYSTPLSTRYIYDCCCFFFLFLSSIIIIFSSFSTTCFLNLLILFSGYIKNQSFFNFFNSSAKKVT